MKSTWKKLERVLGDWKNESLNIFNFYVNCICSTNPCFLGNKKYFETCIANKTNVICLDACGFGPPEIEFKMICENNECKLATFNRTSGERLS